MDHPARWNFGWTYYLTAAILFGAAVLRAFLTYRGSPDLASALALLAAGLALFVANSLLSLRWLAVAPISIVLQAGVIMALLFMPGYPDYFAILFGIVSMQIMRWTNPRLGGLGIALFAPMMYYPLAQVYEFDKAIAFTIVYTAICAFLAAYSLATRRAQDARAKTQALAEELQTANRALQTHALRLERMAVSKERNRLARELHDSVTQTIFSMTLTTKSALMLMDKDPGQVSEQLDRLTLLARSATAEMQTLISELRPAHVGDDGLAAAVQRYLSDSYIPDGLSIDLIVDGDRRLEGGEEQTLFRIIQEAVNNIIKHANTDRASIRLRLHDPLQIEIEDQGMGFDLQQARDSAGVGLAGMEERAAEIGWALDIATAPEQGTRLRLTRPVHGEDADGQFS